MSRYTTIGEAFFAEILGDIDGLLKRIEHLPTIVDRCEERLSRKAARLEEAGTRYGQAVSGFTQEAKTELSVFLENKTEEQVSTIRELVLSALKTESDSTLSPYCEVIRKTRTGWIIAHGVTALCASALTALLVRLVG